MHAKLQLGDQTQHIQPELGISACSTFCQGLSISARSTFYQGLSIPAPECNQGCLDHPSHHPPFKDTARQIKRVEYRQVILRLQTFTNPRNRAHTHTRTHTYTHTYTHTKTHLHEHVLGHWFAIPVHCHSSIGHAHYSPCQSLSCNDKGSANKKNVFAVYPA